MPGSSEEQGAPIKRTSRKRVAAVDAAAPRRIVSTTRRVVVPKKVEREDPVETVQARKAPTPLAADVKERSEKKRQFIIVIILLVIGIGTSAAVGFYGEGQINVQQTIEARNERIRNNQADDQDTLVTQIEVPVQDTDTLGKVDGGLIGLGTSGQAPEPVTDIATSTATSTEMMASSTDSVASSTEESVEEVISEEATP